ncbi:TIGR04438 family Trp-rich protein [Variovorax soli]|jgi:small Trp-rich protein|uniref:TIGR04438 family Trp-rich protein n=1 Tax=Variovorax soli TaxID=376815 RepID=UPI000838EBC7|nr:TIGR04438 family Trp-rich protein [Variovorax soli]
MWFLGLGLLGVALKFLEIGPVAQWSWLVVLIPFGLAIVWWAWADWSGYTKRKAVEREDQRRQDRIDRQRSQLGMLNSRSRKGGRR